MGCASPVDIPNSSGNDSPSVAPQLDLPPTSTKIMTATSLPTLDPDSALTFGGAATEPVRDTSTPTATSTLTSLPPVPDFEEVLTLALGGGGGECGVQYPNQWPAFDIVQYGNTLAICIFGVNFGLPFQLAFVAPNGTKMQPLELLVDQRTWEVKWEGYLQDDFNGYATWGNEGTFVSFNIWWPGNYPAGQWQVRATGGGLEASGKFIVERNDSASIIALKPDSRNTITPGIIGGPHALNLENRNVNIVGMGFPANIPIYVLVYRNATSWDDFELVYKTSVQSNSSGTITTSIKEQLDKGQSYLIVGISDPNEGLIENGVFNDLLPHDYFKVSSPNAASSKIDEKYMALGGERSVLGNPNGPEQDTSDGKGRFRDFQFGSIYWTSETGAYEVHGKIRARWIEFGAEKSFLGYPITDELTTPDDIGRYNHFQYGSIYWTPDTGAYEVHGLIRDKWADLGWEQSFLGYPITDELTTPDGIGRYNHFQAGSIYWTPDTGAHEVHGLIRELWANLGWEKSCLGYPIGDEEPSSEGWSRQSRFQHGIIRWSPDKGAQHTCYSN